jgi:quercetin dioxygenase-like cupin family protein
VGRYNSSVREPLTAELADLENCLRSLGKRPLKLIADEVRPEFGETAWEDPAWCVKKLLAHAEDSFQFSIGGPQSKQDYHRHDYTFEIFVSYSPITVWFEGGERRVQSGVVIIPPGVAHRVEFSGTTFVFQAATGGAQVHADREPATPQAPLQSLP